MLWVGGCEFLDLGKEPREKMQVLVTGISGFVGSQLLKECNRLNKFKILGLDKKILSSLNSYEAEILSCDLNNLQSQRNDKVLAKFSGVVVHLAAARTDDASADEYFDDNVEATLALLRELTPDLIIKFIHVSSVAAIDGEKLIEKDVVLAKNPDDLYRYTKYKQQIIVEEWCKANKVNLVVIAPSAVHDDTARDDTNIGRLKKYIEFVPVMPRIQTRKSLTSLRSLTDAIVEQIQSPIVSFDIKKYILIDRPVLTVNEIVQLHSNNKIVLIPVPFLQLILILIARIVFVLGLDKRLPLTVFRVRKLFKDTSYFDQSMYEIYASGRKIE